MTLSALFSASTDLMGISSVSFIPEHPTGNAPFNIVMDGHTSSALTGGKTEVSLNVLGINLSSNTFDTCSELGVTCPLAPESNFNATLMYPELSAIPAGVDASLKLTMKDDEGATLLSLNGKVETGKSPTLRASHTSRQSIEFMFEAWRRQFKMVFATAEEHMKRLDIFAANHVRILEHNRSGATYTMAHNQFSHMTPEEFEAAYLSGLEAVDMEGNKKPFVMESFGDSIPESQDWTAKGAVTAVKNQGSCGACWAFSTVAVVESAYFLKTGELHTFSEQELLDCDKRDHACAGGDIMRAYDYVETSGLAKEAEYYYAAVRHSCHHEYERALPAGAITGFVQIPAGDEDALKAAVATRPVSVQVEADKKVFQFYHSGIVTGECGDKLNHGVLAVGYGVEDGVDYWKVKNSWGAEWGDNGYVRVQRGTDKCGIAHAASYPTTD